jgi:hypothetical protein
MVVSRTMGWITGKVSRLVFMGGNGGVVIMLMNDTITLESKLTFSNGVPLFKAADI